MAIHAPIQFFQDEVVIFENTFLPIPIQHETEKDITFLLVIIQNLGCAM